MPQGARKDDVDTGGADHLLRGNALRLPGQEADRVHAVAAEIHHRAAAELGAEAGVLGPAFDCQREAEGDADEPQRSDRTVGDEFRELRRLRMVAPHEPLGEDEPFRFGGGEGLLNRRGMPGERFLAKDVLAGLDCAHRPLDVPPVRQGDVDGFDVFVLEQCVVTPVGALDPVLARIRLSTCGITAGDGDHLRPLGLPRRRDDRAVDRGSRDQAPLDAHSFGSSVVIACSSSALVAPVMIATASGIVCVWGVTTATRLPSRMIRIRSASSKTCGMSWLIMITGRPRSRTRWIRSSTWRVSRTPRAAVGSSMIASLRAHFAARATATP